MPKRHTRQARQSGQMADDPWGPPWGPVVRVIQSLRVVRADTTNDRGCCRSRWPAVMPPSSREGFAMATLSTSHDLAAARGLSLGQRILAAACALGGLAVTGCQVDVGGQTLPSAYYLQDDIQYFPAGPEFKLSKEAAAQKAYKKQMREQDAAGPYRP